MRFSSLVVLLSVLLFVKSGSCGISHGRVFLRLLYFNNPKGVGNNGHICEGKNIFKFLTTDECDHFFDITLQSFEGRHLARKETPATDNSRTIHFGGRVKGMPNPLTFRVRQMHHFHIKIRVMDEDKNSNDFVGDFVTSIVTLPVGMNGGQTKRRISQHLHTDRSLEIKFQLWGQCDRNYYGRNCDVKCVPRSSDFSGHYGCDPATGRKVCRPGYTGQDCLRRNHCASGPCQNGASCVNSISGFVCRCTKGYRGETCADRQPLQPCAAAPCRNGATCTESGAAFRCKCARGFVGARCDRDVDECFQAAPCLHNGTCHNSVGSFRCACVNGFSGAHCERPPPREEPPARSGGAEPASQQMAHMARAKENPARSGPENNLLWPYLVAVAAVIIAVVCLAFMVTLYRRRRFIVIKERNGETVAYTANPPPQGPQENVYISDEGSDSTFYEDIDRHFSLGLNEEEEEEEEEEEGENGCYSGLAPPADFANASYGGFSSSREEV